MKSEAIKELAKICADLREIDPELSDMALCAYAAVKDESEKPRVDLTYSSIMRDLRKNKDDRIVEFQKVFKESFENALDADVDDVENVALLDAIDAIEYET